MVASLLCGLTPNTGVLILARLIQGGFAAMMLPQGFGILREVFPPDEQQQAFAIFGPVIGFSAVLGPIIGGSLIDWNLLGSGWRLVFLVNVPLGIAAIIGAVRLLPASKPDHSIKPGPGRHRTGQRVRRTPCLSPDPGSGVRLAVVDVRLDGRRRRLAGRVRRAAAAARRRRATRRW